MRRQPSIAATVLFILAAATPAFADDRSICFSLGNDNYRYEDKISPGIRACGRMIDSGEFKGKYLASIYRARASWKEKKGEYDAALDDYNTSIKLEPDNVESYDYRADVYQDKGDLDAALADYDRATKIDPNYASAYYSRGRIFEKKGDIERARVEYGAAIALPTANRIAQWAQDNARKRLAELDAAKTGDEDRKKTPEKEPRKKPDDGNSGGGKTHD